MVFKRFNFWFTILSFLICAINYLGYDERNILLSYISPNYWFAEKYWFGINIIPPSGIPTLIVYLITIAFWYFVGKIIDGIIRWFTD